MSISKKIRFEIFKRDKFTCQYCGASAPGTVLHVDHIQPVSKNGEDDIINLITACFDCNMGKKDRELSDESVMQKRKKQLDDLQERREQIEMMVEWQQSLMGLDEEAAIKAKEFWEELVAGYTLNEHGIKSLRQWIIKYGLKPVLESMRTSAQQYLKSDAEEKLTSDSVSKSFNMIQKICAGKDRFDKKPYLKDLYYIRGIMRNRFSYLNDWKAIEIMEGAYKAGVEIDDIKQVALDTKNWTEWQAGITAITPSDKKDDHE